MDNFDLKKYLAESKLFEEDFKNPILDKYLKLKKSIDYKTVFPTDLQSFVDSLDNTERDGLENDLAEGVTADEIASRVRKLGKEKGIEDEYIEDYIDELDGNFEPDAYENSTDKDLLDDLKSYIDLSEGVIKENITKLDNYALEIYSDFRKDPSIHFPDVEFKVDEEGFALENDSNYSQLKKYNKEISALYTLFGDESGVKDKNGLQLSMYDVIDNLAEAKQLNENEDDGNQIYEDYTSEYDEETAKRNMFAASYNKPGDTERFRDYMDFLTKLRDSGKTNMFGAAPYLQQAFDLEKKEARKLLAYWMGSYRNEGVFNRVDEGSCGYTPDGKPRSKPASPDLMKEAEYAADKFNVNVFGYQTKYYKVCPGAKAFMDKVMSGDYGDMSDIKEETIRLAKLHDVLFKMEIQALKDPNYATKILSQAKYVVDTIRDQIDTMNKGNNKNIPMDAVDYLDNHIEIIKDAGK